MTLWCSNQSKEPGSAPFAGESTWFYLGVYCALGVLQQIVVLCRALLFATAGVHASVVLHRQVCMGGVVLDLAHFLFSLNSILLVGLDRVLFPHCRFFLSST